MGEKDMRLPFTQEQFFGVFESYNTAVFPMQILLALIGCAMIICVLMNRSRITGFLLGCVWIWTGFAYHIMFFTRINKAAFIFGAAFIAQGVLFIILAYRFQFLFVYRKDTVKRISSFFILFGLVLYPIIGYILEQSPVHVISFGLPCPTTIFTCGMLGLHDGKIKMRYLIIPLVWSFIGLFAAILMGVYQDVLMPVAAIFTILVCNKSKR